MNIRKSKIKCPTKNWYDAAVIRGESNSDILINGYFRKYKVINLIPMEICTLIDCWYSDDYVHLFYNGLYHWSMSIYIILNDLE